MFPQRSTKGTFNAYSAGNKVYGSGRSNPTMGPVDMLGYRQRDRQAAARREALVRRLKNLGKSNG